MPVSLYIPIRGTSDAVSLPLDDLPADVLLVVDILRAEVAPLDLWLHIAIEYYKRGFEEQFRILLEEGSSSEIEQHYHECTTERMSILNALGVYHTQKGMKCKNKEERSQCFEIATGYFKNADSIDIHESLTWIGKGLIFLATGELQRANLQFSSFLERDPSNIPALLGKACVSFLSGDYKGAMRCYVTALKSNPQCPAPIRLGIGLCAFKMDSMRVAAMAFERVLEIDRYNVHALVGLAVIADSAGFSHPSSIQRSIEYLERAYELDPSHAIVCTMLSNHLFYLGDHSAVDKLCTLSNSATNSRVLLARNCYLLGRSHQVRGNARGAFSFYQRAAVNDPDMTLAQFGMAQMHARAGDYASAQICLHKVYETNQDTFEVVKLLGIVCSRSGDVERAETLLKRAIDLRPNDVDVLLEYASLVQERYHDPAQLQLALTTYQRVVELLQKRKKKKKHVPYHVFNNMAVLCLKLGNTSEALDLLNEADKAAEASQSICPALKYNRALVHENLGDLNLAEELYNGILEQQPSYFECSLRLSKIAQRREDSPAAEQILRRVLESSPNNVDALTALACLKLQTGASSEASSLFTKVLQTVNDDAYCKLSLGNIALEKALEAKDAKDTPKFSTQFHRAGKFYRSVLQRDPGNGYAANAIGAVLAYRHRLEEARSVLNDVRESGVFIPSAWLNLAHIFVMQNHFDRAIKLYEACSKKAYGQDVDVLLYLARAYYQNDQYQEAKKVLSRAVRLRPADGRLWYNLALSCEQDSISILQKNKTERTYDEVKMACSDIKTASNIFSSMLEYSSLLEQAGCATVENHARFCRQGGENARPHLAYAEQRHKAKLKEEHETRRGIEEHERKINEQRRVTEELRLKKEEDEKRLLMERQLRLEEIIREKRKRQEEENSAVAGSPSKKRKRSSKTASLPSDEEDFPELSLSDREEVPSVAEEIFADSRNAKLKEIANMTKGLQSRNSKPSFRKAGRLRRAVDTDTGDEHIELPEPSATGSMIVES